MALATQWVIEGPVEDGEKLFWSNEHGWAHRELATVFTRDEMATLEKPQGAYAWVPLDAPKVEPRPGFAVVDTAFEPHELIAWQDLDAFVHGGLHAPSPDGAREALKVIGRWLDRIAPESPDLEDF